MARLNLGWLAMLSCLYLVAFVATNDTINAGDGIRDGQSLVSIGGVFRMGSFAPGSSRFRYLGIWYNAISPQTVVWVANRERGIGGSTGILSFHRNGSLVLSDARGEVYWSTGEGTGVSNPVARLLDSGNFRVIGSGSLDAAGAPFSWQSFDHPTDTMLPGMTLGWDRLTGRSRNITSWRSAVDPAPGEYSLVMEAQGEPQIFLVKGTTRLWRMGGAASTGSSIGNLGIGYMFSFSEDASFQFDAKSGTKLWRMVLTSVGREELLVWIKGPWVRVWEAPKPENQCELINHCGPFSICDIDDSPICSCVHGFNPRSPQDWHLRDGKDGCVRRTALDCLNGTDGFVLVDAAKLPDTSKAVVYREIALAECRAVCLSNCSCIAYANAALTGGGVGCYLWVGNLTDFGVYGGGQDLFVRVAAADLETPAAASRAASRKGVVATCVVFGALILGCTGWCVWKKKRRAKTNTVVLGGNDDDLGLPLFDFATIAAATDDFSAEKKLGQGGFGPVYMGRLRDGQEVAVKRLARNSTQGPDEFKNEVELIAKLQHRNLVRLLGFCVQWEERMLVYEYMHNKSLDAFLFDNTKSSLLGWNSRYHIINGIARGLLYLHQDSRLRIIHRDLKASNVLLDREMNPKISDFGMARIFGGEETEANTRRVVGTYGYMSPEYAMDGVFSVKSDVFSFGVLVLEIVTGKRNRNVYFSNPILNLLGYVWTLRKEGNVLNLVDPAMENSYPEEEVLKCIKLGLLCVQDWPEDRPTMASVLQLLTIDVASLPQPKQPGFMAARGLHEPSSSSCEGKSSTMNEVTISAVEGR